MHGMSFDHCVRNHDDCPMHDRCGCRETWHSPEPVRLAGSVWVFRGNVLSRVHSRSDCQELGTPARPCVIHNRSDHHMRDFPLHWRDDRAIFERICRHGVGHPDPDQFAFWEETNQEHQSVHGCDGCCGVPPTHCGVDPTHGPLHHNRSGTPVCERCSGELCDDCFDAEEATWD